MSQTRTMTAVWGPLGWMTLHSVATSFPERPAPTEKQLMMSWLELFRDTITCVHCRDHFTKSLANYRARFPGMMDSRQEFAMFSFRVHNVVNARLNKPVYNSLDECMAVLQKNTLTRSAQEYRNAYLNHIQRYWSTMQDVSGIVALKKVIEMRKIENEYIARRDTKFHIALLSQPTTIPRAWVEGESAETTSAPVRLPTGGPAGILRLGPGGFRIRK